ncbi:MAG: hypothetical protein WDO70_12105 [Alphaproteobacteria bacterium]
MSGVPEREADDDIKAAFMQLVAKNAEAAHGAGMPSLLNVTLKQSDASPFLPSAERAADMNFPLPFTGDRPEVPHLIVEFDMKDESQKMEWRLLHKALSSNRTKELGGVLQIDGKRTRWVIPMGHMRYDGKASRRQRILDAHKTEKEGVYEPTLLATIRSAIELPKVPGGGSTPFTPAAPLPN